MLDGTLARGCRALPQAAPASSLSSADALAVADRLLAAEATWHQGHSLAQTAFTCLYLLQPDKCVPVLFIRLSTGHPGSTMFAD